MKGRVSKDHVHVPISRLMQWLKRKTGHQLPAEFPHLKKQFRGRHPGRAAISVAVLAM